MSFMREKITFPTYRVTMYLTFFKKDIKIYKRKGDLYFMRETGRNGFKKRLKDRLVSTFPRCMIFDLNPNDNQGIPDLLILFRDRWASLEAKGYFNSPHRPNQDYYVDLMNNMSFSSFIFPENEEQVIEQLHNHFYQS